MGNVAETLLTRNRVPEYLAGMGIVMAYSTFEKLAVNGGGPPFRKFGRRVYYPEDELKAWAEAKLSGLHYSTSSAKER